MPGAVDKESYRIESPVITTGFLTSDDNTCERADIAHRHTINRRYNPFRSTDQIADKVYNAGKGQEV